MDTHRHACRSFFYRFVDRVYVVIDKLLRILTTLPHDLAILGVAQYCNRHFVHLQVGASPLHEIGYLFTHHAREIGEEYHSIRIHGAVEQSVSAQVRDRRCRQVGLRGAPGEPLKKGEVIRRQWFTTVDFSNHAWLTRIVPLRPVVKPELKIRYGWF